MSRRYRMEWRTTDDIEHRVYARNRMEVISYMVDLATRTDVCEVFVYDGENFMDMAPVCIYEDGEVIE